MSTTRRYVRKTVRVLSAVTGLAQTLPAISPVVDSVVNALTIAAATAELTLPFLDHDRLVDGSVTYRATNAASSACTS